MQRTVQRWDADPDQLNQILRRIMAMLRRSRGHEIVTAMASDGSRIEGLVLANATIFGDDAFIDMEGVPYEMESEHSPDGTVTIRQPISLDAEDRVAIAVALLVWLHRRHGHEDVAHHFGPVLHSIKEIE